MRRKQRGETNIDEFALCGHHYGAWDLIYRHGLSLAAVAHLICGPSHAAGAFRSDAEMRQVAEEHRDLLMVPARDRRPTWAAENLLSERKDEQR
ncbi:MAG: hypothetical protein IPM24_03935 [Bryobacterales bacterium]|nr:hypothetical protein [Bryobacterales bacterium]